MYIKAGLLFNYVSIINMMLAEFFKSLANYMFGPAFRQWHSFCY